MTQTFYSNSALDGTLEAALAQIAREFPAFTVKSVQTKYDSQTNVESWKIAVQTA